MTASIKDLSDAASLKEAQIMLGALLNLDGPAAEDISARAMTDQKFAFYLIMTKDSPSLRETILKAPPSKTPDMQLFEPNQGMPAGVRNRSSNDGKSNTELVKQAATSLLKWGATGFKKADEALVNQRRAACGSCEFLADPPETFMYQGLKMMIGKETKICSSCGCAIDKKTQIPDEKCPQSDPGNPELSRWGEPWG